MAVLGDRPGQLSGAGGRRSWAFIESLVGLGPPRHHPGMSADFIAYAPRMVPRIAHMSRLILLRSPLLDDLPARWAVFTRPA